jgi:hypothetical protein
MGLSVDVGVSRVSRFFPPVRTFLFATHSLTDVQQLSRIVLMRAALSCAVRRKDARNP